MKKGLLLFILLLPLTLCCAAAETSAPIWERDAKTHWHVTASGEKTEEAPHVLEDILCTVCGTEVWVYEDGAADLCNYSGQGELLRATAVDADGQITADSVIDYGCDEQGRKLWEKQYEMGRLATQITYAVNAAGESLPLWSEAYDEDGAWGRNEYDEAGNCIRLYAYDAQGHLTSEEICEYAQDADGWYYMTCSTVRMEGTVFINEYNHYGDWTRSYIEEADGTVVSDTVFVHEYEADVKRSSRTYDTGVLVWEEQYDENGMTVREIEYLEDGSTVVYEYDETGELIGA